MKEEVEKEVVEEVDKEVEVEWDGAENNGDGGRWVAHFKNAFLAILGQQVFINNNDIDIATEVQTWEHKSNNKTFTSLYLSS